MGIKDSVNSDPPQQPLFLKRWSERKARAREPKPTPREAAPPAPVPKPLTDADMPALESISERSDLSPFFAAGVSRGLRRLALRRLFHAPAFNVTDGLNDYDENFTRFTELGGTVTQEMRHRLAQEAQRLMAMDNSTPAQTAETAADPQTQSAASSTQDNEHG